MATLIVRTNPNGTKDGRWECTQCHKVHDTFDAARECATVDYEIRTGRKPTSKEV